MCRIKYNKDGSYDIECFTGIETSNTGEEYIEWMKKNGDNYDTKEYDNLRNLSKEK